MANPSDYPHLRSARDLPGADKASEFMVHAIQEVIDGRAEVRMYHRDVAKLFEDLHSPNGAVAQLASNVAALRAISDRRHTADQELLHDIRGELEKFNLRLTGIEARESETKRYVDERVQTLRMEFNQLVLRVEQIEKQVSSDAKH